MSKRYTLLCCLIIIIAIGTGCSKQNSSPSQTEYISMTNEKEDISESENLLQISTVKGISFAVREKDYNKEFVFNPLSVLNNTISPAYFDDEEYEYTKLNLTEDTMICNDNTFILYSSESCLYQVYSNKSLGTSIMYYYNQDVAEQEIKNTILSKVQNIVFDETSCVFEEIESGEYLYSVNINFEMDKRDCSGKIVIKENDSFQTFFFVGGTDFSDDEKNEIISSLRYSDKYESAANLYDESPLLIDYNGVLLSGNFSEVLGLNADIDDVFRYSDKTNYINSPEPYFMNPYYNCLIKYNVYTLPGEVTPEEFCTSGMYFNKSDFFPDDIRIRHINLSTYQITDRDGAVWTKYTSEISSDSTGSFMGGFTQTSLYIRMNGTECIIFQLWCNKEDDFFVTAMDNGISSVNISPGNTYPPDILIQMQETYYNCFGNVEAATETATSTDAVPNEE